MNDQERAEHNRLFEEASAMINEEIQFHDRPLLPPPGWWLRRRLKRALSLFHRVLELRPENWSAMWLAAKVRQRLGDEKAAFEWFERAYQVNPSQPDVAREASLTAMNIGRTDAAVVYAFRATQIEPESAGLHANLALVYVLDGQLEQARKSIEHSLGLDPSDTISQTIKAIIEFFATHPIPPPKTTEGLKQFWRKARVA